MEPKVFKLLIVAILLSTVHAGYKRIRKKIIIYVPEVTKVIHHKHVAKVVVPQIIYKDFKPSKEHGVGLEADYGPYAFEHVGKGYGGLEHPGAAYSTIDYSGKGYPGSELYGGFSHEKGDFHASASTNGATFGGQGGTYGTATHGGSHGSAPHVGDWKGDAGTSAFSARHPQHAQPTFYKQVVLRYGQPPAQPPAHGGWASGAVNTGETTLRRQASRTAVSSVGGGWVSVGGVEVARGRDVLAGA